MSPAFVHTGFLSFSLVEGAVFLAVCGFRWGGRCLSGCLWLSLGRALSFWLFVAFVAGGRCLSGCLWLSLRGGAVFLEPV